MLAIFLILMNISVILFVYFKLKNIKIIFFYVLEHLKSPTNMFKHKNMRKKITEKIIII